MKKTTLIFLTLFLLIFSCVGCSENNIETISAGYAEYELIPNDTSGPLYISGYKQGVEIEGVLDYQKVKAIYINYYGNEVLMISIDCIGLSSNTINKIRQGINKDININVAATHTHAGIDTLGLWGPVAMNGKNESFMNLLIETAIKAGNEAIINNKQGILTFGKTQTKDILEDSRYPYIYDDNIYQLRFIPDDKSEAIRMIFYGAHAEALRGDNNLLSADFPGYMSKVIKENTGDNCIYFNGAIGGLIMTKVFDNQNLVNNMYITGEKLAECVLSIKEEKLVDGQLKQETIEFDIELENTLYRYYKFLGILDNPINFNIFKGKYYFKTETSVLQISNLTFILIPGEIFPELVLGGSYINPEGNNLNPQTIQELTLGKNIENLIIIGLCNDEIGYIIPPSDFLVDEKYPYINKYEDQNGENHYEETNSVGINAAYELITAIKEALSKI